MSTPQESPLKRWLAAERDSRPEAEREAEEALFELFEALPLFSPSAGFADRVLERAGLTTPAPADLFASRWVRVLLAACLPGVALGVLSAPSVFEALFRLGSLFSFSFGHLVQGGIELAIQALVALAGAVRLGEWVLAVSRALTLPLATPQVSGAMLGCLLVSAVSFFVLRDLISRQRWNYVDS